MGQDMLPETLKQRLTQALILALQEVIDGLNIGLIGVRKRGLVLDLLDKLVTLLDRLDRRRVKSLCKERINLIKDVVAAFLRSSRRARIDLVFLHWLGRLLLLLLQIILLLSLTRRWRLFTRNDPERSLELFVTLCALQTDKLVVLVLYIVVHALIGHVVGALRVHERRLCIQRSVCVIADVVLASNQISETRLQIGIQSTLARARSGIGLVDYDHVRGIEIDVHAKFEVDEVA